MLSDKDIELSDDLKKTLSKEAREILEAVAKLCQKADAYVDKDKKAKDTPLGAVTTALCHIMELAESGEWGALGIISTMTIEEHDGVRLLVIRPSSGPGRVLVGQVEEMAQAINLCLATNEKIQRTMNASKKRNKYKEN